MVFLRDALITIAILIVVVWLVVFARVRGGGLSADAQPGALERTIAGRLVRLSIPSDAKQQKNPFGTDATTWRTAAAHYGDHCATCHGTDGRGQTVMGRNMYPKTPDLSGPTVQRLSDGELFYVIQNGVRWTGMPSWKSEHTEEETWRLVSFIRALPMLTPADLEDAGVTMPPGGGDHHHHHEHGAEPHPDHGAEPHSDHEH